MEVRNCKGCNRLFNYIGGAPLCPSCLKLLEEKFQDVKKYINDNPGSNIQKVADDCEVSVQQIKKWVREERLAFCDDSPVGLECENCGKMIKTGRYCEECKGKVINRLESAYQKPKQPEAKKKEKTKERMRFLE